MIPVGLDHRRVHSVLVSRSAWGPHSVKRWTSEVGNRSWFNVRAREFHECVRDRFSGRVHVAFAGVERHLLYAAHLNGNFPRLRCKFCPSFALTRFRHLRHACAQNGVR